MNDEQLFTTHKFAVNMDEKPRSKRFTLVPLGDQHLESTSCDEDRYSETLSLCRKLPNPYFLFMGDEHSFLATSERAALDSAKLHNETIEGLDQLRHQSCVRFVKQHEWMRGRILGMLQGNHHWVFRTKDEKRGYAPGMTSTEWIAAALGTRCLGFLSYITLSCSLYTGNSRIRVDVVACHGKAGGKLIGTSINQVNDLREIFRVADIYLMGHNHQRQAVPVTHLFVPSGNTHSAVPVKQRRQWLGRTGSFLKGYAPNTKGYIIGRLLRPSELGIIYFDCRLLRRGRHPQVEDMDIHCWS